MWSQAFLNGSLAEDGLFLPWPHVVWRCELSVYLFYPRIMKSKHVCLSGGFDQFSDHKVAE